MKKQPNAKNVCDPDQARSMRKLQRLPNRDESEDEADEEFHDKPDEAIEKNKKELKNTQIKAQIEYFGYVLEPFNMNNEKKFGNIDGDGFFVYDKDKERQIRDPWLDALDQDPYNQGIHPNNENLQELEAEDEAKEINKKTKIDVSKEDFDEMQIKMAEEKKNEKISHVNLVELAEKLIALLEKGQNPNNLLSKIRPIAQTQQVFKKNIRKNNNKKDQNKNKKIKEEEKEENNEKFKEIIEICDILSSNGCLEIYSQSKEEIEEFLNEKLKKNIGIEQHLINSDVEFKDDEEDDSESDEQYKIFQDKKAKLAQNEEKK